MKITKSVKAVGYAVFAVCITLIAVWTVSPLHNTVDYVKAYWRSDVLLFAMACTVLGVGVYSFFGYTRRHKAHRVDSWFFMAVGALLLILSVAVILRFGGITEENFDTTANAALNLNIGVASVVPLPFLVRGWVLACTTRFTRQQRLVSVGAMMVATILYVAMVVGGRLLFQVTLLTE